jgi:enoyl-CoA hydratase/carnithine racemase
MTDQAQTPSVNDHPEVLFRMEGSVGILTLNRPEKMNAFSDGMRAQYLELLNHITYDRSVRALVITGAGKGFCAGGDIKGMKARMNAPIGEMGFNGWTRQQYVGSTVSALMNMPKPTIAAVNGPAMGLGADLALSCDFVMAADNALFAWSYILRGIIPDGGGMYFLPRRVGLAKAKELLFTGQKVSAIDAKSLGIADRVVTPQDLLEQAITWAKELSQGSEAAIALTKSIINRTFESQAELIFSQGSQAQGLCYTTQDHHNAVQAFLDQSSANKKST